METSIHPRPDRAARRAGWLLLLTAAATVVAVAGRVSAGADLPTLEESLAAIGAARGSYGLGAAARLLSGITLAVGARFLLRIWIMRERLGTRAVPLLLTGSGALTALSGTCAVVLALVANPSEAAAFGATAPAMAILDSLHGVAGKAGFSLAGLALIAAAYRMWRVGGVLRFIAPGSAVVGVAMQLVWVHAVIVVHRVSGAAFVVWLTLIGIMLVTGRVERIFASLLRRKRAEEIARRYRKGFARSVAAATGLRGWADRGSWPEDG
ncbi:MAG: hypothetical protein OXQ31_08435 [Spirochaetaceae bacterium]|nr:hypothetical protein [Spirochaetaceae bacterium]